jgi:transcriptional regulator with XRE-family HTH domain
MNSVERVKAICKERKIAISKLEKDLGFSNGYISQLRKGSFPADRLMAIAEYLGLSVDYLATGDNEKKPALKNENELDDTTKELVELAYELDDADRQMLLEMARSIRRRREG